MYTSIVEGDQVSLDLELLREVGLKLLVDVLDNGATAVLLVDLVSKPSSAHNCQTQLHIALLQVCTSQRQTTSSTTLIKDHLHHWIIQ